ncbi:hypothetical protein EVG20_g10436 [Dentipellis fragilis]|uniref:Uncharacterized protein n=1 Tax=Dentipellis fragilis TaxID=205917 RepID=A0A4Y9XRF9_9AGAM|nr:hypothetical protein EVG20_g10436 [Dentipellis fragilis]
MALDPDRAIMGAIFGECIVYGIGLTMGIVTVVVCIKEWSARGIVVVQKPLLLVMLVMFSLATAHVALSLVRLLNRFTENQYLPRGDPATPSLQISTSIFVARDVILLLQTWLGDSVYIWRCYVLWYRHKRVVIAPTITVIIGLVCGSMAAYNIAHTDNVFGAPSGWIQASSVLVLATNIYCNGERAAVVIIWRIWQADRFTRKHVPVLAVVIEAGVLYTSNLVALLIAYWVDSYGGDIALDLVTQFVPVVFCLIILQINYYRTEGTEVYQSSVKGPSQVLPWVVASPTSQSQHAKSASATYPIVRDDSRSDSPATRAFEFPPSTHGGSEESSTTSASVGPGVGVGVEHFRRKGDGAMYVYGPGRPDSEEVLDIHRTKSLDSVGEVWMQ